MAGLRCPCRWRAMTIGIDWPHLPCQTCRDCQPQNRDRSTIAAFSAVMVNVNDPICNTPGRIEKTVISRLVIEQLRAAHLIELATYLRHAEVYQHIGGVPSLEDFVCDREIALHGPGSAASGEIWLNFLVRDASTNQMLGRLEATLHDSIAEVAFLFDRKQWGKGYASEALAWLHREIENTHGISSFWATTVPANVRCQSLLLRAGYQLTHEGVPLLYSIEEGDLAFHLRSPA